MSGAGEGPARPPAASQTPAMGPANPVQGWLGLSEAAAYLGVSVSAVKVWRRMGTFPAACMLGRLPRWARGDLDQWVASRREKAGRRSGVIQWTRRSSRTERL